MSTSDHAPTQLPVVTAAGDLDADNLTPLDAQLRAASASAPAVILDISGVTFGDSSFLNLLLRTHQRTDLRLVGLCPPLERLFSIVGVDAVLRTYPTIAEARSIPH